MTSDHEERATAWEETFRRFYPACTARSSRSCSTASLPATRCKRHSSRVCADRLRAITPSRAGSSVLRRARHIRGFRLPLRLDELVGSLREPEIPAETETLLDRLALGELLRLLTRRQRAVVVAHYYLGLTQQEIADALGVRRGTVGATLSQALSHMRR